jgi:GH24 family phage-related lysozyme (muramidase)/cell wall-associated NlpC family hydrolase
MNIQLGLFLNRTNTLDTHVPNTTPTPVLPEDRASLSAARQKEAYAAAMQRMQNIYSFHHNLMMNMNVGPHIPIFNFLSKFPSWGSNHNNNLNYSLMRFSPYALPTPLAEWNFCTPNQFSDRSNESYPFIGFPNNYSYASNASFNTPSLTNPGFLNPSQVPSNANTGAYVQPQLNSFEPSQIPNANIGSSNAFANPPLAANQLPSLPPQSTAAAINLNFGAILDPKKILNTAFSWLGKKFKPGVSAQCINWIRDVFKQAGQKLPENLGKSIDGASYGVQEAGSLLKDSIGQVIKDKSKIQPGDLIFWKKTYGNFGNDVTHIGIATGNGKMIDRGASNAPIVERPIDTFGNFVAAVRPHAYKNTNTTSSPVASSVAAPISSTPQSLSAGRQVSENMLQKIKDWEGLFLKTYLCPAGVPTIGYGHAMFTAAEKAKYANGITKEQATQLLRQDLKRFETAVLRLVKVPLKPGQFDALVSFAYNCGEGALQKSNLLKFVNQGNFSAAANEFGKFIRGAGKVLPGLVRRREDEAKDFRSA